MILHAQSAKLRHSGLRSNRLDIHTRPDDDNRRNWVRKTYRIMLRAETWPGEARFHLWNTLFDITLRDNAVTFTPWNHEERACAES